MENFHQPNPKKMTCYHDEVNPLTLFVKEGSNLLFFFFFFKPQTYVSSSCQPLQHPWDSHVSVWANSGSPPEVLNTTSGPAATSPTRSGCWAWHQLCKQVVWISVMSSASANSPPGTADWHAVHVAFCPSPRCPSWLYFYHRAELYGSRHWQVSSWPLGV